MELWTNRPTFTMVHLPDSEHTNRAITYVLSIFLAFRFEYHETKFIELTEVLEGIFKLNAPFAKENFFPITRGWPSGKEVRQMCGLRCLYEYPQGHIAL